MTLDRAWDRWAGASKSQMSADLFGPAVAAHRSTLGEWLKRPSDRPLVVAADSKGEALAFLACLSRDGEAPAEFLDRAVVINSARTLRTLAPSTSSFIPIVSDDETERELGHRRRHSIVVRPRNAVDREPDIALGLLGHRTFEEVACGYGACARRDDRLARESGRSPTILRRRLSKNGAIRRPRWAEESGIARKLVPMALVGAWHAESKADREVLHTLTSRPFREIEEDVRAAWVRR